MEKLGKRYTSRIRKSITEKGVSNFISLKL